MNYEEFAKQFFYKSYQLKKIHHQQMIDECLQGEIFALLYIKQRNDYVLPSEISDEMKISSARVATILNNLEHKDLIKREIDPTDRRRILVSLTPSGDERAKRHNQKVIQLIARMLESLGEQDAKEFVRITGRIVDLALEKVDD